jgi:hypothetical protein
MTIPARARGAISSPPWALPHRRAQAAQEAPCGTARRHPLHPLCADLTPIATSYNPPENLHALD